jgi:hypothetical protein
MLVRFHHLKQVLEMFSDFLFFELFSTEHMKWTQIKPKLAPFRARGISSACQCYTDPNATFPSEGSCFGPGIPLS